MQFIQCFLQIIVFSVISFRFLTCFLGCFVHEFLTFILDFLHRKLHFWVSFSHAACGQKSLVFRTKPPLFHPIFHPQRTVRITHEKRLPAKCRSAEICAAKDHTGSCRAAAVQSNKKQKGRFSSEHQDHSKAVRRHRISVPAAPPAPRCTERCRKHGPGAPLRSTCAAVTAPCWHRSHWTRSTASPWTAA